MKEQAKRDGMKTMTDDGWRRVADGTTTPAEVLRVCKDETDFGF